MDEALVWAGKAEHASYFEFRPHALGLMASDLYPSMTFTLLLYDREKNHLGSAYPWWSKADVEESDYGPSGAPRLGTDVSGSQYFIPPFGIEYSQ